MKEQTWTFVDKTAWPAGQWQHEPDKMQWTDAASGLPCLAVRNHAGVWCGYVGVAEGHPLFQVGYDDVEADIDVHGGLTYSALCDEMNAPHGICHIPEPGQPDHVWWLGFDTAHAGDLMPPYAALYGLLRGDTYKDLNYVRAECSSLAAQLAALVADGLTR